MSDENQTNGQGGDANDAPPITINVQYVKDLSFENPNAPASLVQQESPDVELRVDVGARQLGPNLFEVLLSINASAKHADDVAFLVECAYAGVVTLNVPEEHLQPVLLIEVPRLLFPFARSIVANAVRDGGFPPLMVQPIDFLDLFRRRMAAAQAEQEAAGTA